MNDVANKQFFVYPVANTMHSLFRQVEVMLGNKAITKTCDHYAYLAYLDILLGYSKQTKDTMYNNLVGFFQDDSDHMGIATTNAEIKSNSAIELRQKMF